MNEIKTYANSEFGEVRTVLIGDEPYFVGKDIAVILGYERATKAIRDHVDNEDVDEVPIQDSIGRMQNTPVINESGLYSLILSSKLPTAKRFKRWVTSEVLPSIRRTGRYDIKDSYAIDDPVERAKRWIEEETIRRKQAEQIEEMTPKALFADSVATSGTTILVGELAKILKGNGIDIGQNRLFNWMRQCGYLISRKGSDWNMPTQRAMELGLFKIKETAINHSDGSTSISKTVKVTGKGQSYFINKFIGGHHEKAGGIKAN